MPWKQKRISSVLKATRKPGESVVAKEFPMEHGRVQMLANKLLDDGLDASASLVCGSGVETTLKEAEILETGLIVIGTHGHGAVYDVLIGSSQQVLSASQNYRCW